MEHLKILIPKEITNIILLYYCIKLEFYTKQHGPSLQFINEKTVKMNENCNSGSPSTCLFGADGVTNKDCNKYDVTFKITSEKPNFLMGYTTSIDGIKDWNDCLGLDENYGTSVGFWIVDDSQSCTQYRSY